jgi:hypothetical protein
MKSDEEVGGAGDLVACQWSAHVLLGAPAFRSSKPEEQKVLTRDPPPYWRARKSTTQAVMEVR